MLGKSTLKTYSKHIWRPCQCNCHPAMITTRYLVANIFFDANWNTIQQTFLVGGKSFQLVKTLKQDPSAAVELFVYIQSLNKEKKQTNRPDTFGFKRLVMENMKI